MDSPMEARRREGKGSLHGTQRERWAISWLAVAVGILLGVLGLAMSGQGWVSDDPDSSVWLTRRFEVFGPSLFGLVFLIGSYAALSNRRRAGLIFLSGAPVVASVLSYPGAGYLVWTPDGAGTFELPLLPTAVGLSCLFYLPFVAPLLVKSSRRRALWVFVITAVVVALAFAASRWTAALLPRLAGWSALFLLFGGFWLGTHKLAWPALRSGSTNSRRRLAMVVANACWWHFWALRKS
jgi:hypothetical protein